MSFAVGQSTCHQPVISPLQPTSRGVIVDFRVGFRTVVECRTCNTGVNSMGIQMIKFTGRLLSLTAATLMVSTAIASAETMDKLVAAAKAEGQLTTIALPHDWCGYGAVIDGFKAKYPEITV